MSKVKNIVPTTWKNKLKAKMARAILGYDYSFPTFSHCGEDRIIRYLFNKRKHGSFVDVGAYHPLLSSNTMLFYTEAWRGVNIDPLPGGMELFNKYRPEDTNLEVAVSDTEGDVVYYMIGDKPHQMNSIVPEFQEKFFEDFKIDPATVNKIMVQSRPLAALLDENTWPAKPDIDFLSVDVEGYEMNVLRSNNWEKYRPKLILVENHSEM